MMSAPAVICAFPGVGKTTLARRSTGMIDLDFGHFRSALYVPKEDERAILPAFARLVIRYLSEGWTVLINEPKVLPYLPKWWESTLMVVPEPHSYVWMSSCAKLKEPTPVIKEYVAGWLDYAARCNGVEVRFARKHLFDYDRYSGFLRI